MCGIAGALGGLGFEDAARRMSVALAHRGPDDAGAAVLLGGRGEERGAFAHRRLSIIDLSECGHQPMRSGDGRLEIVYNGEIYNHEDLRRSLAREGASFRGGSDTEVLLEGWRREGPAFLTRLRGMYAFCVWDLERETATLVRDPFGIKPLYVTTRGDQLRFSSETRALGAAASRARTLSREAVAGFLAWGSVPEPLTMYHGVRALPPGTWTRVDLAGGVARVGTTVSFAAPLAPGTDNAPIDDAREAAALVRAALRDSVRRHLVADVPVAVFLSGGIDSSAVLAIAARSRGELLDTFTVGFGDDAQLDESSIAREVAARYRTRHVEIRLTAADLLASLPDAFAAMDQPSMDGLNTFVVSRGVRRAGLKVVLSGLGGDELFAGYPSFRRAAALGRLPRPLASIGRSVRGLVSAVGGIRGEKLAMLLGTADPAESAYRASRVLFPENARRALGAAPAPEGLRPLPPGLALLQRVSWYELTGYTLNTLLRDSDVFSMAHGLELRVPFLDLDVAQAAMRVSDSLKLVPGAVKPALVRAVEDLIPRTVWDRPKRGFLLPFARWMRQELREEVAAALTPSRLARVGLDGAAARAVWADFERGSRGATWSRSWALFTLVRWAEQTGASVHEEAPAVTALRGVA